MSIGAIYNYAANSHNIFIIPWSWSCMTDDFSIFFSGYVMMWSPNSKHNSSGNLLFLLLPVLSVNWSDTSGNYFSCLPKIYLYIHVRVELQTLGCDDSTCSNFLFGVHKDLEHFRDIQTCENTTGCEHSSSWMTEICPKVNRHLNIWVRQSGCLFQWCKALTLNSLCESEPTSVSRGHFLSVHLFLSCPYCPD